MEPSPVFAKQALEAGAVGFVLKDTADDELPQAVRTATAGGEYVSPRVVEGLDVLRRGVSKNGLTPRELEVLRLIALGHTNTEIASKLYLSVRTVESHRAHIQQKTRRTTRADLVAYAREHNIL
jgi:two-component system response regulator NreC